MNGSMELGARTFLTRLTQLRVASVLYLLYCRRRTQGLHTLLQIFQPFVEDFPPILTSLNTSLNLFSYRPSQAYFWAYSFNLIRTRRIHRERGEWVGRNWVLIPQLLGVFLWNCSARYSLCFNIRIQ